MTGSRTMVAALAASILGCGGVTSLPGEPGAGATSGGDPLDGIWIADITMDGLTATETFTLAADGTASLDTTFPPTPGGECTGSVDFSGMTWTATSTTITLSTSTCTGTLTCGGLSQNPCASGTTPGSTCDYTLSDGDATLVLTCGGVPITFDKQG